MPQNPYDFAGRRKKRISRRKKQKMMMRALGLLVLLGVIIAVFMQCAGSWSVQKEYTPETADGSSLGETQQTENVNSSLYNGYTVCIDPGHGYYDSGTISDYLGDLAEKEITLAVSLLLGDKLEAQGFTVLMTREDDIPPQGSEETYVYGPTARAQWANQQGCDLYCSVHCDSYEEDESISGPRVFYYDKDSVTVDSCAKAVAAAMSDQLGLQVEAMSDSADNTYKVLLLTDATSVLVELGFVSNQQDAKNLISATYQDRLAQSLADGIMAYFDTLK